MSVTLEARLNALRRQAGQARSPDADSHAVGSDDLRQRMRRLRPRTPQSAAGTGRPDDAAIADLVGGRVLDTGVVVTEQIHPEDASHGRVDLRFSAETLAVLTEAQGLGRDGLLFLDTETSGLAGGSGTSVFVLGLGRFRDDQLVVRQYLLTAFAGERCLLEAMAGWVDEAAALVSYNGKSFDVPLLATRHRMLGLRDCLSRRRHVDLLHPTRRAFSTRWEDCRLARAEQRLLGFEREDDLSGAEAPQAWFDWLHHADPGRLPDVLRHNHWDLVSLAALMPALAEVHRRPDRHGADRLALARHYRRIDGEARALSLLTEDRSTLEPAERLELADLYRRRGDWDQACALWRELAGQACIGAIESLAKYHEHVARDYVAALAYAERLPDGPERRQRRARLLRKSATRASSPTPPSVALDATA
jgi:hypothetical protein